MGRYDNSRRIKLRGHPDRIEPIRASNEINYQWLIESENIRIIRLAFMMYDIAIEERTCFLPGVMYRVFMIA